ncbi:MAG: AraC family transcriptional regulator [Clostridia bacterium]|nr:AraC family transcriptional regulator [Clostridia bacterium]
MNVREFAEKTGMKVLTGDKGLDKELAGAYVCDLLSWVMSHANKNNAWITVHTHLNVVAVALLTEVACVIIPEGIHVEEPTVNKAMEEGIAILSSDKSAYEICCLAHEFKV